MTGLTLNYGNAQNLNTYDRILSAILGSIMIGSVFNLGSGMNLGWLALLPILGIYPCLAAIIGFSPIRAVFYAVQERIKRHRSSYHVRQSKHMDIIAH